MGSPGYIPTGRVFFTAEESQRFRAVRIRLCSERAAREAFGCNQLMFEHATGQGRVMPATREKMLAKLAEIEGSSE